MATEPQVLDVYARVSRLGDDRQRSTDGQVSDCTARVADLGARVGMVHVDAGRSAWRAQVRRPGWDTLMTRLESGATDGVVVFDLARFSRRPIEGERLIAAAERGLTVLDSEDAYDLRSASGKKSFRDQLAGAAYESDRLSTRTKRGKRIKALHGEPHVSARPFGFEADGVTIRPAEADILRDLAERLLSGETLDAMAADLNARGVTTARGKRWDGVLLRQVMVRPRNCGQVVHLGAVVATMPGDPIWTTETFERVSAVFAARRRGRPASDAYLCSGVLRCGRCGHHLTGRPRPHLRPYPDGTVRREYWCAPRANGNAGCGRIRVEMRAMDGHAEALAVRVLSDPRHAAAVEAAAKAAAEARHVIEAQIAEAEQLAAQLADRLGRGEITLARYDAATAPLDRRIAELGRQLSDLGAPPPDVTAAEAAASRAEWQERWDAATVPERRTLLRQALRARRLVVMPAEPNAAPRFDARRVVLDEPKD